MLKPLWGTLFALLSLSARAQSPRLLEYHAIGWLAYSGDFKLSPRWTLHTDYQLRRVALLGRQQQQLARAGLVRRLGERLVLGAGYAYTRTSRYGDYPSIVGRPRPEHRLYQDLTLTDHLGRLRLDHRWRLEQRWLGQRADQGTGPVANWQYVNRVRYQVAARFPLRPGLSPAGREWYLSGYEELFIGFGRQVGEDVFNQNRLSAGLGYQFGPQGQLQLNYLNQIGQHDVPDPTSGRAVFEINHGFLLSAQFTVDLTRKQ